MGIAAQANALLVTGTVVRVALQVSFIIATVELVKPVQADVQIAQKGIV